MFKIGKFQGILKSKFGIILSKNELEFQGVQEKMVWNSRRPGVVKNKMEFQGMTSENGYPHGKFLEKPIVQSQNLF